MEVFDDRPWLPVLLLISLPLLLQAPLWLLRWSTDPIWFVSGVTQGAHLVPGAPYLDPNVGFTSEALGRLAAWDWVHGIIPWWNPFTGIGVPLAGELQPGAFFLPFNLLLLLPEGLLWQRIAMEILAGLTTYALLRELGLGRLAALTGGVLFALNGTIAWSPGPAAVYCSLPFLPLLLWGIERARRPNQGAVSILAVGVAIAWSILAGFPEPAYISGLLALIWGVYRLVSAPQRWMMARRTIGGWALGMLVASPLLISFADYLRQSDSFTIHRLDHASLSWAALPAMCMPYIYGPLGSNLGSKSLEEVWGSIGGFTTVLVITMAVAALGRPSSNRGLRYLLISWILLTWARTFGIQPVMAILNHVPLLDHAVFSRYASPSWILAFAILAAFGLEDFRNHPPSRWKSFSVLIALLSVCLALAWPRRVFWAWSRTQSIAMFGILALSFAWTLALLLALWLIWSMRHTENRRLALASLLVFDAASMFVIAQASGMRNRHMDTQAIQFLHDHQGLSRTHTLWPLEPNYGAYFQISSIDHNVLPNPRLWVRYVDEELFPGVLKDIGGIVFWPGWDGYQQNAGEENFIQHLDQYQQVGVRYLITKPGQSPLPTTFLPNKDFASALSGAKGAALSRQERAARLLRWCRSASNDPKRSSLERFIAGTIARRFSGLSNEEAGPQNRPSETGENAGEASDLTLLSGQTAEVSVPAFDVSQNGSAIGSVGILLGDQSANADGELSATICAGQTCQSGSRTVTPSSQAAIFQIPLVQPLSVPDNFLVRVKFTREHGSQPLALKVLTAGTGHSITTSSGILDGKTLALALVHSVGSPGMHKVYSDSLMDIWETPNPAPYFQVIQGGPCSLSSTNREHLTAECATESVLRRRELFMPGWRVAINGTRLDVKQDGIFQAVILPAGHSGVSFHFSPPYVEAGWAVCLAGGAGLLWQIVIIARGKALPRFAAGTGGV